MKSYIETMLVALENQELEGINDLLEKALAEDEPEVLEAAAAQLVAMGFLAEAEQIYRQLLKQFPSEVSLNIPLAEIAIENNLLENALELLDQVTEEDPAFPQRLVVEADLYQVLDMPEVSETKLLQAKALLPGEFIIDFALAELYYVSGNFKKAIPMYQKFSQEQGFTFSGISLHDRLGNAYSKSGDFEAAIPHFESSLKENETPDRLFQLGLTYLQLGENQKGILLLKKLYEEHSDYYSVYLHLADALMEEEELTEGMKVAEAGIRANPYQIELYHLAAEFAYRLHQSEKSEYYLLEALKLAEETDTTMMVLTNLYLNEEKYEEIVDLAPDITSSQPYLIWNLAKAYYHLEEFEEAKKYYQSIEDTLGNEPDFLREYGMFLREEGIMSQAVKLLTNYLHKVPDDIEIQGVVNELDTYEE